MSSVHCGRRTAIGVADIAATPLPLGGQISAARGSRPVVGSLPRSASASLAPACAEATRGTPTCGSARCCRRGRHAWHESTSFGEAAPRREVDASHVPGRCPSRLFSGTGTYLVSARGYVLPLRTFAPDAAWHWGGRGVGAGLSRRRPSRPRPSCPSCVASPCLSHPSLPRPRTRPRTLHPRGCSTRGCAPQTQPFAVNPTRPLSVRAF